MLPSHPLPTWALQYGTLQQRVTLQHARINCYQDFIPTSNELVTYDSTRRQSSCEWVTFAKAIHVVVVVDRPSADSVHVQVGRTLNSWWTKLNYNTVSRIPHQPPFAFIIKDDGLLNIPHCENVFCSRVVEEEKGRDQRMIWKWFSERVVNWNAEVIISTLLSHCSWALR